MTNPDNVGGLPELPASLDELIRKVTDHANSDGDFVSQATQTAIDNLRDRIRAYALSAIAARQEGLVLDKLDARIACEKNKTRRWALICFRDELITAAPKAAGE